MAADLGEHEGIYPLISLLTLGQTDTKQLADDVGESARSGADAQHAQSIALPSVKRDGRRVRRSRA